MTSRRCTLLEEGARELLELDHYTVRIVPVGYRRLLPPAHLVASRGPYETRYIRIRKVSSRSRTVRNIETLAGPARLPGLHCEIWIYSLHEGYHCFEVLTGSVRDIPKLTPDTGIPLPDRAASS
jgi:hypothetical protein